LATTCAYACLFIAEQPFAGTIPSKDAVICVTKHRAIITLAFFFPHNECGHEPGMAVTITVYLPQA
jgi:hypothetical protein